MCFSASLMVYVQLFINNTQFNSQLLSGIKTVNIRTYSTYLQNGISPTPRFLPFLVAAASLYFQKFVVTPFTIEQLSFLFSSYRQQLILFSFQSRSTVKTNPLHILFADNRRILPWFLLHQSPCRFSVRFYFLFYGFLGQFDQFLRQQIEALVLFFLKSKVLDQFFLSDFNLFLAVSLVAFTVHADSLSTAHVV